MATLDQIHDKVEQLRGELAVAIAAQKLSPKQITIVNGLSDINNSLGSVRAGEFLALSNGEDPQDSNGTGTFISAQGRTFGSKLYHIGGVLNSDLKWGANALTGELEAGDGAVNLTANGLSLYDGATEIGRFGNLAGFLSYPASPAVYGMAMGDSDQYMTYDQTNGLKVYGAVVSDREILTAARTYYVATTGNDANSGLAVGSPFLTIQHAIDVIADNLDIRNYNVTIQIADGTYTQATPLTLKSALGNGQINITGNVTTPANVILQTTAASTYTVLADGVTTVYNFSGEKMLSTRSAFNITNKSKITITAMDFGACTASHLLVQWGGVIEILGNYTISGSANQHYRAVEQGFILYNGDGMTVTVSGTPAFGDFATSNILAAIYVPTITWTGSATGRRYYSSFNAFIGTGSAGANYFPGNSAGATATGGLYD